VRCRKSARNLQKNFTLSSALVTSADRGGNFKAMVPAKCGQHGIGGRELVGRPGWQALRRRGAVAGSEQHSGVDHRVPGGEQQPVPLGEPVERASLKNAGP
jgi:hypothetical protein